MKTKIFIFCLLIVTITACKKAELKKPTTLNVQFGINSNKNNANGVKFNSAELTIQIFSITGKRIEGDNIDFNRVLDSPLEIDLDGQTNIDELQFDIPQGDYTELNIEFNSLSSSFFGKYKLSNGPLVDVVFELTNQHLFTILCDDNNQTDLIQLDKNLERTVCVILNSKSWFNSISGAQLDDADLTIGNNGVGIGNSTILINPSNNIFLYNSIVENIALSNKASFK